MNIYALFHKPDSNYCFPTEKDTVVLRLRTKKEDTIDSISVIYACKYEFQLNRQEAEMKKRYTDQLFDFYELELKLQDVRLAYIFILYSGGEKYYYSEDGLTETYNFNLGYYNFFQLPYINPSDVMETVEWMKSAVFYQIFIDRFLIGDKEKDQSYINLGWGEKPTPKSFAGGDLKGIRQKLDYIKGLGMNALYLTPIFPSISNHKYDIMDYKNIDPQFGTKKEFKLLVEEAHAKGIRIVLDAVFNHCSSKMEQFKDVVQKGKQSTYFDWFIINGDKPIEEEINYECFGSCSYMPKLNTSNPEVCAFLLDIACYWIKEFDIDGWRLDVSDEISHDFWRQFRKAVKSIKPDCVIIGENWHDAYPFLMGDQYDSIMNYAFTKACLDYFVFMTADAEGMAQKLNSILMRNKKPVNEMMMNLLDTHDTHRFYTETKLDKRKVLSALAIEVCFVGAPCIYYGTEIGLEGGYDPDNRRTFDWNEEHWDLTFLEQVKAIVALKQQKELQQGDIFITAKEQALILDRSFQDNHVILLHNHSSHALTEPELNIVIPEINLNDILVSEGYTSAGLCTEGFLVVKKKAGEEAEDRS